MRITRRLLATVALSTFLAACGGTESDSGALAEETSAARGGKKGSGGGSGGGTTPTPSPTDASVTAANSTYNGYSTVKLYPGSWMDQQLWVQVRCYQNGALVYDASNGFELHYGVQAGVAGYSFAGDHFERVFGPFRTSIYTGGAASCAITAIGRDSSGAYSTIATGSFSLL